MSEPFSISREFDFVRLDGLRRATGRPPHEWDIYIVKELIDNALDADEMLWRDDLAKYPRVHVHIEYTPVSGNNSQQFFVQVTNRATFPAAKIGAIFATQWYTSGKAFIKNLNRGALGNALKTILRIPYALRNRVAEDWGPDLKPLSITCGGREYLPRYLVDSTGQTLRLTVDSKANRHKDGTAISVGLDCFGQEVPRTLGDIQVLAQQYRLCNPHVEFHWSVEVGAQEWTKEYPADTKWTDKYRGTSIVRWYSAADFQELLGALYRKEHGDDEKGELDLASCGVWFAGFADGKPAKSPMCGGHTVQLDGESRSAKMRRRRSGLSQKNQRTRRRIFAWTRLLRTSAIFGALRLWMRSEQSSQRRQGERGVGS